MAENKGNKVAFLCCEIFTTYIEFVHYFLKEGGLIKRKMQINHLRNHYSEYVFLFIKKHINEINLDMKICDVGAGHLRNLKLFEELGFNNLYAVDRENTDNPLEVNLKKFILQDIEKKIPLGDKEFDIVLCNFVLMFVNPSKINQVMDDLLRITNKFLIIETNKQKYKKCKTTHFKDYSFKDIVNQIEKNPDFELIQVRKHYEKLIARRVK